MRIGHESTSHRARLPEQEQEEEEVECAVFREQLEVGERPADAQIVELGALGPRLTKLKPARDQHRPGADEFDGGDGEYDRNRNGLEHHEAPQVAT
jgi:hypothetical protein